RRSRGGNESRAGGRPYALTPTVVDQKPSDEARRDGHRERSTSLRGGRTKDLAKSFPAAHSIHLGSGSRPSDVPGGEMGRSAVQRTYLRSLFDSMSNHIANKVNCDPKMRSSATRTIDARSEERRGG